MEQFVKFKRTWNLVPVLQIPGRIPESYCPCLNLSVGQIRWNNELWFKRHSKMHPVSCSNTLSWRYRFVNHGIVKNTKTWLSWEWNINFLQNKKILNLYLRWHILRSYRFIAEATFKAKFLEEWHLAMAEFDVMCRNTNKSSVNLCYKIKSQLTYTCSNTTTATLEKGVKYVQK